MPSWLTDLIKSGVGTPGAYAAMAYVLCLWMDNKASEEAKRAITTLLQPKEYNASAVGDAIVEIFDWVYTKHLLSWRAFVRSTLFTLCVTIIVLYETFPGKKDSALYLMWGTDFQVARDVAISLGVSIGTNIISDYVSLFAVRRLLIAQRDKPLFALWIGPLTGITIVVLFNLLFSDVALALILFLLAHGLNGSLSHYLNFLYSILEGTFELPEWRGLLAAGLIVHLWLPLFSFCVGLLRGANYLRQAVGWTQWFMKEGPQHPFHAIGCVSAAIVFICTSAMIIA